jgi:hypothetical protein
MTHILLIKIFTLSSQVKARHDQELLLQCVIPPSPFVPRILLSKMRGVLQGPRVC